LKRWIVLIILITIGVWYAYDKYDQHTKHQLHIAYWLECHNFIDLIDSNENGLRPDPGGTITILNSPVGETIYTQGSQWPHDHCFDPMVCGPYSFTYSGSFPDCTGCVGSGTTTLYIPCEGGGSEDCCEKYIVEISAPYELLCDESVEICAVTNNYVNPDFVWSTGETTECIDVIMAGTYSVTVSEDVTDDCMCMGAAVEKIVISDSDLSCSVENVKICRNNTPSGQFDLTVTGSNAPFTYVWSGPNGFTSTVEDPIVTDDGAYHVEVTDAEGCTVMCSANLFVKTTFQNEDCL